MAIASGSRHELTIIKEIKPGQTPANPQTVCLRHVGCSLNLSRDSFQSNELRGDRMIADVRTGCDKVGGGIDFELSYGEFDTLLAAALAGNWASDVLKAGTAEHAFTIQRAFGNGAYGVYRGCYVNQVSLSIKPNAMVTGSFTVVGMTGDFVATPLCAAPTPSQLNRGYDSYTGTLTSGGTEIAVITGLDISLDNGIEPQFVIGGKTAPFVSFGRSNLSGTVTAFFADRTMLDLFLDETPASLAFTFGKVDGTENAYSLTIPRAIYTGADAPASGEGPITLSMPFMAVLDSVEGSNIKLTRHPKIVTPPVPDPDPDPDPDPSI